MMRYEFLQLHSAVSVQRMLADRLRQVRLGLGLKQSTLALRSGVSLPTLRRFERTGEVSLKHLARLCEALGRLEEFDGLFRAPPAKTMAELESRVARPIRKRGSD
jgi:transcriptional regulator with XRE-family HTH domain